MAGYFFKPLEKKRETLYLQCVSSPISGFFVSIKIITVSNHKPQKRELREITIQTQGQAMGKMTGCEANFAHLVQLSRGKVFLCKEVNLKKFCLPVKN